MQKILIAKCGCGQHIEFNVRQIIHVQVELT
jgi:hypothetical protein